MRRRDFLYACGGALAAWPCAARAQQDKFHIIGVLVLGNPEPSEFLAVTRDEMAKLGYAEGRNCRYEVRSADGDAKRLPALALELVKLPVNVLVTWQTPPTIAARNVTRDVPIVM